MQRFPGAIAFLAFLILPAPEGAFAQSTNMDLSGRFSDRAVRQKAVPAYATWQQAWDDSWAHAQQHYRFDAAPTVAADPACRGDLDFHGTVSQVIAAVAARRYGDALRHTGTFQDRFLCLPREGARGVEFALSTFLYRSLHYLPPDQARIAVHGVLNLGMLSFDQLQYTRSSWWLPAVGHQHARIVPLLSDYPADLGLLMYDFERGALVQVPGMDRLVGAMQQFSRFGEGTCTLLEMARAEFDCARAGGGGKLAGSGRGNLPGAGGMELPSGGTVACTIDAARTAGSRGMAACMQKATAGMTFDPRTATPQSLLSPQPGIRDPRCALSQEAGTGAAAPAAAAAEAKKEPPWWEKVAGAVWEAVKAVFDKTPDPLPSADLASEQGANAARNALIGLKENENKQNLLSDDGIEKYYKNRENAPAPADFEGRRGPDVDGPLGGAGGGGGCGNGSNAAKRAQALYRCTGGDTVKPERHGPRGGIDPIARTTDPEYKPAGSMACLMQGGDLMRTSFSDPKCASMRCAEGAICPCNRTGGGNNLPGTGVASNPNDVTPIINCSGNQSRTALGTGGDPCGTLGGVGGTGGGGQGPGGGGDPRPGGGGPTPMGGGGGPTPMGGGPAPMGGGGGITPMVSPRGSGTPVGRGQQPAMRPDAANMPGSRGAFDELERETQSVPRVR